MSIILKVANKSGQIAAVIVAAKVISFYREILVAKALGTTEIADAFILAMVLPNFIVNVVAGSFSSSLMPALFRRMRHAGNAGAQELINSAILLGGGATLLLSALLFISARHNLKILSHDLPASTISIALPVYWTLLPTIVLNSLATIWTVVANSADRYFIAAARTVITPLLVIVVLLLYPNTSSAYVVAFTVLLGSVLETAVMASVVRNVGFRVLPVWRKMDPDVILMLRQYAPVAAGASLLSFTSVYDQYMAASVGSGSVAIFGYSTRIVSAVLGTLVAAMGTVIMPLYSRAYADQDWSQLRHLLTKLLVPAFIGGALLSLGFSLTSSHLTNLFYGTGKISPDDLHSIANLQAIYACQIPFYLGGIIVVRLISAIQRNGYFLFSTAVSITLSVTLNSLLVPRLGLISLCLVTTAVYIVSLLLAYSYCRYALGSEEALASSAI